MSKLTKLVISLSFLLLVGCTHRNEEFNGEKIYLMEKDGKTIPLIENRDIIKILDLPKTRQAANWTCGANAVQKVCEYYGEDYREMDLVNMLNSTPDNGTDLQPIIDFFVDKKFKIDVKEHMTIDELKEYGIEVETLTFIEEAWRDG